MSDQNKALRKQQKNEIFVPSDLDDPSKILRYIETPEPHIMRIKMVKSAKDGEMPLPQRLCPHPVSSIDWMYDHINERDREGRPTNIFECRLCHANLMLVDGSGKSASDG